MKRREIMKNGNQEGSEIIKKMLEETRNRYPLTLRAEDISEILGCKNKSQVYRLVKRIPGAKKIESLGWRIPRDQFFAWYYFSQGEMGYKEVKARL